MISFFKRISNNGLPAVPLGSPSSLLFEGIVFTTGIFLICYRGYDVKDFWITTVSGIMALLLTLFPTSAINYDSINFIGLHTNVTQWIHQVSAILFFTGLAFMEICQFTKTNMEIMTTKKKIRNVIYRTCGIGMLSIIIICGAINFLFKTSYILYIGEGIGLELFGIAWLVKGETILKD